MIGCLLLTYFYSIQAVGTIVSLGFEILIACRLSLVTQPTKTHERRKQHTVVFSTPKKEAGLEWNGAEEHRNGEEKKVQN